MKTKGILASIALGVGMVVSFAGGVNFKQALATGYKDEYNNIPEADDVPADSYFTNAWHHDVGTRRIDKRALLVRSEAGWGQRGKFLKKYDIRNFSITLDLEGMLKSNCMLMTFAKTEGGYVSEEGKVISFDIIKAVNRDDLFRVTVSNTLHNISVEGFSDGKNWEDDANYQGVTVEATDQRITISFKYIDDSRTDITVNGTPYSVDSKVLYSAVTDSYELHSTLGIFNGTGSVNKFIIESVGDESDETYYSSTGTYGVVESGLNSLKVADYSTPEATIEAKNQFNDIPFSSLYSYDKGYLKGLYDEVDGIINAAIATHGNAVKLDLFKGAVSDLKTIVANLKTVEDVNSAIAKSTYCETLKADVDVDTLSSDLLAEYNTAVSDFETAYAAAIAAVNPLYDQGVKAYEAKVEALKSALDIKDAYKLRNDIPTALAQYITTEDAEAFQNRIIAADAKLNDNTTLDHEKWVQGENAHVVSEDDGSLDLYSYSGAMGQSPETSSGIYLQEAVSAIDFDLEFNVHDLGDANGSWLTFGLLEKPEMWIFADDDSVQDNKGIFFLVNRIDSTTMKVQAFLCSLRSNRFYDSALTQTIIIPVDETIKMSFYVETQEIAGVSMELFQMKFNNVLFDQETITSKKIKTVLPEDNKGYFFMASNGLPSTNGAAVTIESINGHKPTETGSFAKTTTDRPSSTDQQKNMKKGETNDIAFNLNTQELPIKSVKVNDVELATANYSYANNTFTLKGSYVSTLDVGVYTVEVNTDGGKVTWKLVVQANAEPSGGDDKGDDKPSEPAKKGGCGGSVVAASALISVLSLAGFGLLLSKKRK